MRRSFSQGLTLAFVRTARLSLDPVSVLLERIQHRFRARITEWAGAAQMCILGAVLLAQSDSFAEFPAYAMMAGFRLPEVFWGWLLLGLGVLRVIGLIINGSMKSVTPWIRVTGAFVGFACFAMITVSMIASVRLLGVVIPSGVEMYLVASCMEIAAIYFAFADARMYYDGSRNQSRPA